MTQGGWITMIISVSAVSLLFLCCIWRVLTSKPPAHVHGIEDIDTQDHGD